MNTDWQTAMSLAIVALSAAFLLRQVVLFVTRPQSRGCGSCPSSKSGGHSKALSLVQISSPLSRSSKEPKTH